jgi:rhodanese-related sulfurtransferase
MTQTIPTLLAPAELEALLAQRSDIRILDVRMPGEYQSAHISGSYNVPLDTLSEHAAEIARESQLHYVLVCQSGARARIGEETLRSAGAMRLHLLDDGMNGWLAEKRPARFGVKRISLERQVRMAAGSLAATGALLALLVSPWFALLPLFVGSGLVFAGITDLCGMAILFSKLPYNRPVSCDVPRVLEALRSGSDPVRRAPTQ